MTLDGRPLVKLRSAPARALLAYLAMEGREVARRREALVELLWPGMPPASGRQNLRQALYELKQALPEIPVKGSGEPAPLILADRQIVRFNLEGDYELDVDAFETLVGKGEEPKLEDALALYQGDFLADFYLPESGEFEAWVASRRAYFRRQALEAMAGLAEGNLARGNFEAAEKWAREQLALDQFIEPAHRQLMKALARSGRRAEVVSHYERLRQLLREELQIEPSPETEKLYLAIASGRMDEPPVALELASQPQKTLQYRSLHNLPPQATVFVGRKQELADIERLLLSDLGVRLLTLIGPGGSGKTRLALEAAGSLVEEAPTHFPDGVWFVPLLALTSADSVIHQVAEALGYSFLSEDDPRQQLLDYLSGKRLLLVMDNYEHLLDVDEPPFAAEILGAAPSAKVLATSRSRLNVHGEQVYPVGGLDLPDEYGDMKSAVVRAGAIKLFLQGTRRVRPDFAVTAETLAGIVRICQLTEGMPLAIELAAAWMELLAPAEIAAEIERGLDFLATEWRDLPQRQRSLRTIFESSWALLGPEEQMVVRSLCVFQGHFTREAAQRVGGTSLRLLLSLANKSWLSREGSGRFQIHSLLRQFGREQLARDETAWRQAQEAHARYYASWLVDLNQAMHGPGQREAFEGIDQAFEDIRQAWSWLVENRQWSILTQQMATPLVYSVNGGIGRATDISALLKLAQERCAADQEDTVDLGILAVAEAVLANGYYGPSYLIGWFTWIPFPAELIEKSWSILATATPDMVDGHWLVISALLYGWSGHREQAIARLQQLVDQLKMGQDRWTLAFALEQMGRCLSQFWFPAMAAFLTPQERLMWDLVTTEDPYKWEEARDLIVEGEAMWKELGDRFRRAECLRLLDMHVRRADPADALNFLKKALFLYQEVGNSVMVANVLGAMADTALWLGDIKEAFALSEEMRLIHERSGQRRLIAYSLSRESMDAARYGRLDRAHQLRERSLAIAREIGDDFQIGWYLWEFGEVERLAGNINQAEGLFKESLKYFEKTSDETGLCFYHRGLAEIALSRGDASSAQRLFQQALSHAAEVRHDWGITFCHSGLARAELQAGRPEIAWEHMAESLRLARLFGFNDLVPNALAGLADWYLASGDTDQAIRLAAFVIEQKITWHETRHRAESTLEKAAVGLPAASVEEAIRQGKELDVPGAVVLALS